MAENDDASNEPSGSNATSTAEAENEAAPEPAMPAGSTDAVAVAPGPSRYRRLHTLSGAVVLGAFLVEHLLTNASALGGVARFDAVVGAIERFSLLPLFEVVFIVVPLAFHAGYGIHLLRRGRTSESTADIERYGDRRLWMLQRVSAVILLVFVLFHIWELRLQRLFGSPADALYTTLTARLSWTWAGVPWIALFYLLGVLAAATHFSNGLFAATAAFQIAADRTGRRRLRMMTTALGLILFLIGGATVIGLATGTRLLPGADDDSAAPSAPCGSAAPAPSPPFTLPTPSR
jgi:succinate dehydrogenase / fumarate reductase cytochrome b subunit